MSYQLANYQQDAVASTYGAYRNGARNVFLVSPTGSGKTVIMGSIAHTYEGYGCSMAHRGHLVGQLSMALAREGLQHDIIAPDAVIRTIVGAHERDFKRTFYNARAPWKVASVQTIVRRELPASWTRQVGMIHGDEGHHYIVGSIWEKAVNIFPNAYGLFPTACCERADGVGLGRGQGGIMDALVIAPDMRWMIDEGHLTDYQVVLPTVDDLDMDDVEVTDSGEYNMVKTRKRVKASKKIVGDVVGKYLEFARGKKGITFAVDIEHAEEICKAYNAAGVEAIVVQDTTSEGDRRNIMERFVYGSLMQLVNVDLFGEGVDVPAVQVVSMARPTASYSLYIQQFGRALRLLVSPILRAAWHTYTKEQRKRFIAESEKPRALIIDHVGNLIKHKGAPDMRTMPWSLDGGACRRAATDGIPLRACGNPMCIKAFERFHPKCPYCGWEPPLPKDRSRPEFCDGDMTLYSPELLREVFKQANKFNANATAEIPYGVDHGSPTAQRLRNLHEANKAAQKLLRDAMALYLPPGVDERKSARRFFHTFGIDTMTAQGLTRDDADALRSKIVEKLRGQMT